MMDQHHISKRAQKTLSITQSIIVSKILIPDAQLPMQHRFLESPQNKTTQENEDKFSTPKIGSFVNN